MKSAPIPLNEEMRLQSVKALKILDTPPEDRFDRITKIAVHLFKVPISTITIMDSKREWYKSCQGLKQRETSRAISFCGHAIGSDGSLIINDTLKDERFKDNPMVIDKPKIRFYAGVPLNSFDGEHIGVFCVKDTNPRKFNEDEKNDLEALAAWVELEMSVRVVSEALINFKKRIHST